VCARKPGLFKTGLLKSGLLISLQLAYLAAGLAGAIIIDNEFSTG
jgi:hypothetical protein